MTINTSPDHGKFGIERHETRLIENPQDQTALDMVDFYKSHRQMKLDLEATDEWQKDNLEFDLRTSQLIIDKCQDNVYAQHLYAALSNNDFMKNDVMPILTEKKWSCSWRYAGGIIADIKQEGDYIDWYCSGIRGNDDDITDNDFNNMSEEQKQYHLETKAYVNEGVVTDEIKQDLFNIGWLVVDGETE
jgi:hypothetical protein